ncbi:MAG TPA: hypothetical protein VK530_18265 [Candidatus Acidoferrum sp.]|nr:hypothetical protein [Candidatus Acidoferrum sp.]
MNFFRFSALVYVDIFCGHYVSWLVSLRADREPGINMNITTQLSLFLENKPGTLARMCESLHKAKINIYAFTTSDTVDHSVVRMIVSDTRKALLLFEEHSVLVIENDVLMIEGDNKPGSLAKIAQKLGAAKVNIEYAYCATPPNETKGLLVLRPSDCKKALKALNT